MKRLFRRKWIIGVLGAALALAIAGSAWAATGSGTQAPVSSATTAATTASASSTGSIAPALKAFLNSKAGRQLKAELSQSKKNTKLNQKRLQSILNLVKAKMTPADQAQLAQLLAQVASERQGAQQAKTNLKNSTSELRTLIDKYLLPAGAGGPSTTSG
jgi:uncharacterized protein YaiL (DUF2058 family)